MKSRIEKALRNALLMNGKMSFELFKFELEVHIDYWKKNMKKGKDEFLFVVTENNGDVAMLLMTNKNKLYINEIARQKLHEYWDENDLYNYNIEFLLPIMTEQLENDIISVNGLKTIENNN
jgi:DNA-dependent RNA polymerase auxiliary subunit epsilon